MEYGHIPVNTTLYLQSDVDGLLTFKADLSALNAVQTQLNAVAKTASTALQTQMAGDWNTLLNKPVLGTAAFSNVSSFATAAQGALAASALQTQAPGDWNTLTNKPTLFDGKYSSLSGAPVFGSAAYANTSAFATASQGALALTALQSQAPADWNTTLNKPVIPQTVATTVHQFMVGYNATNGTFVSAQPSVNDISGLGSAALQPASAFATAAQGALAATALQSVALASVNVAGIVKQAAALTDTQPSTATAITLSVPSLLTNAVTLSSVQSAINMLQGQDNTMAAAFNELVAKLKTAGILSS